MEIDYIKTHMVIERYVQGKLSADEETEFEERLVWDQALQEEVDLAETLRSWMQASAKKADHPISERGGSSGWTPRLLLQPGYAAAASFVLGILITFSALQNIDTEVEFGIDQSAPSLIVPLIVTRSTAGDRQEIPVRAGAVTLLLVDVPDPSQQFNVVVRDSANAVVWRQDGLYAGYLEAVAVGIPGGAVPPGDYALSITSTSADFSQEIAFRTVTSE